MHVDPAAEASLRRVLTELYAAFNVRDVDSLLRAMVASGAEGEPRVQPAASATGLARPAPGPTTTTVTGYRRHDR